MNLNWPDSCANCARNAAARPGASMANSAIADVRNGRSSAFFSGRRRGMIDWSCSAVTIRSPPEDRTAQHIADESGPRDNRVAWHVDDLIPKVDVDTPHPRAEQSCALYGHPPIAVLDIDLRPARQCEDTFVITMHGGCMRGRRGIEPEQLRITNQIGNAAVED